MREYLKQSAAVIAAIMMITSVAVSGVAGTGVSTQQSSSTDDSWVVSQSTAEGTLSLNRTNVTADKGEAFWVAVQYDATTGNDSTQVAGIQYVLEYNTSVLNITEAVVTNSSGENQYLGSGFITQNTTNDTAGTYDFGYARTDDGGATGSGDVTYLKFEVTSERDAPLGLQSQLNFSGVKVSDPDSNPIPTALVNGTVDTTDPYPPMARFTASASTVNVSDPITLNATASTDNYRISSYTWSFGDGTTATGQTVTHSYDESGNYTVNLTVSDVEGNTNTTLTTITVEQPGESTIRGDIHYANGSAAAGEYVTIYGVDAFAGATTWTNKTGVFDTTVETGNTYRVGFAQVSGSQDDTPSFPFDGAPDIYPVGKVTVDGATDLSQVTLPNASLLNVTVVDESGEPIPNASVNIRVSANNASVFAHGSTNDVGALVMETDATPSSPFLEVRGTVNVHVEGTQNYSDAHAETHVGETGEWVRLVVNRTVEVNGQISEADGDPAANDTLEFHGRDGTDDYARVATDSTGNFSASLVENGTYSAIYRQASVKMDANDYPIDGSPDIYALGTDKVSESTGGSFTLPDANTLDVRIVDPAGNPVSNVSVGIAHENDDAHAFVRTVTNANGYVELGATTGVEVTGNVHVNPAIATAELVGQSQTVTVENNTTLTVTVYDAVNVSGRVLYTSGEPAAGQLVTMHSMDDGGINAHNLTNADGAFTTRVGPNSTYRLAFRQRNHETGEFYPDDGNPDIFPITDLTVGTSDYDAGTTTLPAGHDVNVTVVGPNGDPVTDASVQIGHQRNGVETHAGDLTTNAEGTVVFERGSSSGIELANGTLELDIRPPDGSGLMNTRAEYTVDGSENITVTLEPAVNVTGRIVSSEGSSVAGERITINAIDVRSHDTTWTNADGTFAGRIAQGATADVGFIQTESPGSYDESFERDGIVDVYAIDRVNASTDVNLSTVELPTAHVLNVSVVGPNGHAVPDARVIVGHTSGEATAHARGMTNSNGVLANEGTVGVEVNGTVHLHVKPPEESDLQGKTKELTVTNGQQTTVKLEKIGPTVSGTWRGPSGEPIANAQYGIFNFSLGVFRNGQADGNGSFTETLPQDGTYKFQIRSLNTGDGIVDVWGHEKTISGDTQLGELPVPRGYNVTINATTTRDETADTLVSVLGGNRTWFYEYGTGRNLDDHMVGDRKWFHAQTRELANGTHNVTIRDAWTYDKLVETQIDVNGSDKQLNYNVDRYPEFDDSLDDFVIRDLQSPFGRIQTKDELLRNGFNVRLTVYDAASDEMQIRETLPDGFALNTSYGTNGITYDGSGSVNTTYNASTNVLYLNVSGQVTDIRYKVVPNGTTGNVALFEGYYNSTSMSNTGFVWGENEIVGEDYNITGQFVYPNGSASTDDTVAVSGTEDAPYRSIDVTGSDGQFHVTGNTSGVVDLQFYQGDYTDKPIGDVNRDGVVDFFAVERFTQYQKQDENLGTITIPVGHVLNVSVENETGAPVPNATVSLRHYGDYSVAGNTTAGLAGINVDEEGYMHPNGETVPGVEVNGSITITVDAPSGFNQSEYVENVTVDGPTNVTVTLNKSAPSDGGDGGTANLSITDTSINATTIQVGSTVTVGATVTNTGDASGTTTLEFRQNGELLQQLEVTVAANSEKTVSFEETYDTPGTYNLTVDGVGIASLEVQAPDLAVVNATLSDTNVTAGSTVLINATVANNGTASGTLNVTLYVDGEPVAKRPVTVNASSTKMVAFERPFEEPGTYNLSVNNESLPPLEVRQKKTTSTDTPGFGVGPAIVALLGAVALLKRRD